MLRQFCDLCGEEIFETPATITFDKSKYKESCYDLRLTSA